MPHLCPERDILNQDYITCLAGQGMVVPQLDELKL